MASRIVRFDAPYDLIRTVGIARQGPGDPTFRHVDGGVGYATHTPSGPATVAVTQVDDNSVNVAAEGEGAEWIMENAPSLLGGNDDSSGLIPQHGLVRTLHARFKSVRVTRSRMVFQALVPTIMGQKVVVQDAQQSYARLVRRCAVPAPGRPGLLLPPVAETLAAMAYPDYHECGLERKRAETIRFAAKRVNRINECADMSLADAYERLSALPGVGPWTIATIGMPVLGDADAVPLGDFHLPNTVAWALAGEARADDARMMELLEPYRGHRGRVVRYLVLAGIAAPRRGPRMARRDIARM